MTEVTAVVSLNTEVPKFLTPFQSPLPLEKNRLPFVSIAGGCPDCHTPPLAPSGVVLKAPICCKLEAL